MKDFCNLFCSFPASGERDALAIRGYGVNPATAISEAIGDLDALYGRSEREDRQILLASDPDALSIGVAVHSSFGLCQFTKNEGFRFYYSDKDRENPRAVAKQCKNLLAFADNAVSGFLSEYAKWLAKRRSENAIKEDKK